MWCGIYLRINVCTFKVMFTDSGPLLKQYFHGFHEFINVNRFFFFFLTKRTTGFHVIRFKHLFFDRVDQRSKDGRTKTKGTHSFFSQFFFVKHQRGQTPRNRSITSVKVTVSICTIWLKIDVPTKMSRKSPGVGDSLISFSHWPQLGRWKHT